MVKREFNKKLELVNDGQLSLFFIGTGSAFTKKYFNTNLLIIKGETHLLVDCGNLCLFALETLYNTKSTEIQNLFITHPHADHIGGIEELIFTHKYISHSKVNIFISDFFKKKLWNESLKGGCQFSESGKMFFEDYFNQIKPKKICTNPFDIFEFNCGNINIKFFRTLHVTSIPGSLKKSQLSYGIIIDNRILFTGDTQFNLSQLDYILEEYPDIETIFHDCDISNYVTSVHASYNQLKSLSKDVKSKTYLCHYNQNKETVDCKADGFAGFAESGVYYDFN